MASIHARRVTRAVATMPEVAAGSKSGGISNPPPPAVSAEGPIERECTRIIALLVCEQLASLAGVPFSFDPATGPTPLGQLARHRMRSAQHFETIDHLIVFRLAWELWTGTDTRRPGSVVTVVGPLSFASLSPDMRAKVCACLDMLEDSGFDSCEGVPL